MPEATPRFQIPYPSNEVEFWFDTFESMIEQVDSGLFADHEDRNLSLIGGGTVEWTYPDPLNPGYGLLEWSEDIEFVSPSFGKKQTIAAGSQAIAPGEFLSVVLTRGPVSDTSVTPETAGSVDINWGIKSIAYCDAVGNLILFNGVSLSPGVLVHGLAAAPLAGVTVWPYGATATTGYTMDNVTIVGVDSTGGPIQVIIPTALIEKPGSIFVVTDEGGDAMTNNITVVGESAELINGQSDYVIDQSNSSVMLYATGSALFAMANFGGGLGPMSEGVRQTFIKTIKVAADYGWLTLATVGTADVTLESVIVRAVSASQTDLDYIEVKAGTADIVELINSTTGAKANLDVEDEQVAWVGEVDLEVGKTIRANLISTGGSTPVDLIAKISYYSNDGDGGELA